MKTLTFPLTERPSSGIVKYVDSDYIIKNLDNSVVFLDAQNPDKIIAELPIENRFEVLCRDNEKLLFFIKENVLSMADIYCLSLNDFSYELIENSSFRFFLPIGSDGNYRFFKQENKIAKLRNDQDLKEPNLEEIIEIDYPPSECLVITDCIVIPSRSDFIDCFDKSGAHLWRKNLNDLLPKLEEKKDYEIKPFAKGYKNSLLVSAKNYKLISIDIPSGKINWMIDECIDFKWVLTDDGRIITVFKGHLKIISADTGEILSDKLIDEDWVQPNPVMPNLFQIAVTHTHLWCAFLGKGLAAINLETAAVDFHIHPKSTVNSTPKIRNNRMYLQLKGGGIGLDNTGTFECILEGDGGYKPDKDDN